MLPGKYNERSIVGGGDEGSASRFFYCAKASKQDRNEGCENLEEKKYSYDGRDKESKKMLIKEIKAYQITITQL